jgi:hypothetical protein
MADETARRAAKTAAEVAPGRSAVSRRPYLETLRVVTGTSEEDCRRLLIEIEARGVISGGADQRELWALIRNKPLDAQ